MKKYYIFQDEKSQKFWIIENNSLHITTNYGRLGTVGQTKEKKLPTEEEAFKEFEKLIKEKIQKGYIETDELTIFNSDDESKRYFLSGEEVWDDGKDINDLILKIKKDEKLQQYKHISVGMWGEGDEIGCQPLLDFIVENKNDLIHLESLFIGDIDPEECEISWIVQANYTDIFKSLINLKKIKIKGSNNLVLSSINHENLEHLEIICGGLPKSIFSELSQSTLPNLKTLVLYMGIEDYGFDGTIEDIKTILKKDLFPSLENLELVNSVIENKIVQEVINSDILPQLVNISFSYGSLTDEGGEIIASNVEALNHLNQIEIDYHYLSEEMSKKLKKLLPNININNSEYDDAEFDDPDEEAYWIRPMLTE